MIMIMTRKFSLLISTMLFLASLAIAQGKPAGLPPGCGAPAVKFGVTTGREQHPAQPEAGKALVYFIQDDSDFSKLPRPTTRMAIDGEWVGATHANSYSYFPVDPRVHHLCASWQPTDLDHGTAALHLAAEAGGIYFFRVKNRVTSISFVPLDSDEGKFLINQLVASTSRPK